MNLTLIALVLALTACGSVTVKGETKHTVQGEAKVTLQVDAPICKELPEDERAQCVRELLDALTKAQEQVDQPQNISGAQ